MGHYLGRSSEPNDVDPRDCRSRPSWHADGYDPECGACQHRDRPTASELAARTVEACHPNPQCESMARAKADVDPAVVANVDQGAALTAHVLTGYSAQYRAMIADGVDSTTALLSITHTIDQDARAGRKGQDGLVSLVAVAVQMLAGPDPDVSPYTGLPYDDELPVSPAVCTCADGNSGWMECPVHPEPCRSTDVEPWHGKAVESTFVSGPRPRCSQCYGVGQHAAGCRNSLKPLS